MSVLLGVYVLQQTSSDERDHDQSSDPDSDNSGNVGAERDQKGGEKTQNVSKNPHYNFMFN